MRNLIKWALASLLVCSGVLAASQTQNVSQAMSQWVQRPAGKQSAEVRYPGRHRALIELEASVSATRFDPGNAIHSLRLKRIMYYIAQAREYEQQNWQFNRNDAVERASNILRHHQVKTQQGQYVL